MWLSEEDSLYIYVHVIIMLCKVVFTPDKKRPAMRVAMLQKDNAGIPRLK